jgi:hypothetical protein
MASRLKLILGYTTTMMTTRTMMLLLSSVEFFKTLYVANFSFIKRSFFVEQLPNFDKGLCIVCYMFQT